LPYKLSGNENEYTTWKHKTTDWIQHNIEPDNSYFIFNLYKLKNIGQIKLVFRDECLFGKSIKVLNYD
jgi:hypothetical protein